MSKPTCSTCDHWKRHSGEFADERKGNCHALPAAFGLYNESPEDHRCGWHTPAPRPDGERSDDG